MQDSTTKIPNKQLRIALKLVEEGKWCKQEKKLLLHQLDLTTAYISVKDSIIAELVNKASAQQELISNYALSESNLLEQNRVLHVEIRNQRSRGIIRTALCAAGIFVAIFFIR